MIGVNRYSKPVGTVQLGNVAQLPFEQMMQGLMTHQTRYDQIAQAAQQVADRELSYLDPDAEAANEVMQRQRQLEEDILAMGDLSRQSREATDKLRGFTREVYGKSGIGTAIESSYSGYQETLKRIQESNLPQREKDLAMAMWMSQYKGVGEGEDIGYGAKNYNTFGIKNAPEYVDMAEYARKYMVEMDPRILEEENISKSPDGRWFIKKGSRIEELTIDEMVKVVAPIAKNDPKFQEYLKFRGQLYGYQLENTPGALDAINEKRKLEHEKTVEAFNKKKEMAAGFKSATTILEKQKAINKIIDELGIQMPKLKEDGKEGPTTKKAVEDMEVAIKTLDQMDPGQFEEFTMDDAIADFQNESMLGTFRGVADAYDKYNTSSTIDMIKDDFKLQQEQFAFNRRLKEMEQKAVVPRTSDVGGVVSERYKEIDVRVNKDGQLVMGTKHPALDDYNKAIGQIDEQIRFIKTGGVPERQPGNYTSGTSEKVLTKEEEKQVEILEKKKSQAIKARKAKQQELMKNYRADFNSFLASTNPDLLEKDAKGNLKKDKNGNYITKKNASGLSNAWDQYISSNEELYTASGTVFQVPLELEEKIESKILGDGLTTGQIYYVNNKGAVVKMSTDEIEKYGKVKSVNLEGSINPSTSPLKWASGFVLTVQNEEGESKQIYLKQSSKEEDAVGWAGMDIAGAIFNTEQRGTTTQYNIYGKPMYELAYEKTWVNGEPSVGVIVPSYALGMIESSEDRKIAQQLILGQNSNGDLLFDPISYSKFAQIVGSVKMLQN
jgi:hypothetical protein